MVERLKQQISLRDWIYIITLIVAATTFVSENRSTTRALQLAIDTMQDAIESNTCAINEIRLQAAREEGRKEALDEIGRGDIHDGSD